VIMARTGLGGCKVVVDREKGIHGMAGS
jgi:hypothetical protein